MSLSTTNGRMRDFNGQDTENLRNSYMQLGESQIDVNSQLLSPHQTQDVPGTIISSLAVS